LARAIRNHPNWRHYEHIHDHRRHGSVREYGTSSNGENAGKLALESHVIDATTKIGYPMAAIRPIGVIALVCAILYAIPRTAVLGAVLLTGLYGGAVASKIRIEDPLFSSILFGVYFGLIAWGGLYLRDERLRALFPFRR